MDQTVEHRALESLSIGVIVTNPDATIVYANCAASLFLDHSSSGLVRRGGKVYAGDSQARSELQGAISMACDEDDAGAGRYILATAKGDSNTDLAVCVLPMQATVRQALLIVRPIEHDCNLEIEAQRLFGLTRSEARIASAVAGGLSLQEAAERHSVTLSTVRSHMKRIYSKTGVSRQSQVAALLRGAQIPVQADLRISGRLAGSRPGLASQTHRPD